MFFKVLETDAGSIDQLQQYDSTNEMQQAYGAWEKEKLDLMLSLQKWERNSQIQSKSKYKIMKQRQKRSRISK